ncbi:MAG TPA: Mpo1-like protein [Candidatus Kryptonia bacterium]
MTDRFESFSGFYPFYLSEHSTLWCRRMHFIGSSFVLVSLSMFLATGQVLWFVAMPVSGYGFAWIGHFYFEKNKPATFKYPIYSLMGDWAMFRDIIVGKVKL